MRNKILFLAALLVVLSIVSGCGGGGGGSSAPANTTKYVQGTAKITPQAANPYVMLATVVGSNDESELAGVTYVKLTPVTGSGDSDENTYPVAFKLPLPSNPVTGTKYHLDVCNDKDGDGVYDAISQYDGEMAEFLGDWDYVFVFDGTKWHVEDPFGVTPEWGVDATATGDNIVVEAKYLK